MHVIVEAIQTDLGLPVSGVPPVKITFGGSRSPVHPIPETPPTFANPAPMATVQTTDERISTTPAPAPAPATGTPAAPPPYAYDNPPPVPQTPPEQPPSQPF